MPETCNRCGRTYHNPTDHDTHECITTINHYNGLCAEEITRHGQLQPCDRIAIAHRIDTDNHTYPVCRRHLRAPIAPIATITHREDA